MLPGYYTVELKGRYPDGLRKPKDLRTTVYSGMLVTVVAVVVVVIRMTCWNC